MPTFSKSSLAQLATCHPHLQLIFKRVVQVFDCTVTCGHREKEAQEAAFAAGNSKVRWPNGKHNGVPSMAVDVVPYPADYKDRDRLHYFAGYVMGIAAVLGIPLRYGGDWNSDTQTKDNSFDDLVHFELMDT